MDEAQRRQAEEYRAAGMTEEAIAEIAAFDLEVLRSDRRFYRHNQALCPDGRGPEEAPEPLYDGSEPTLSARMDWLQEIGDPVLAEALREQTPEMLEILTLWVFEGRSQREIARKLGCSHQNVSEKLMRLRRYLQWRTGREPEEPSDGGTAVDAPHPALRATFPQGKADGGRDGDGLSANRRHNGGKAST